MFALGVLAGATTMLIGIIVGYGLSKLTLTEDDDSQI